MAARIETMLFVTNPQGEKFRAREVPVRAGRERKPMHNGIAIAREAEFPETL